MPYRKIDPSVRNSAHQLLNLGYDVEEIATSLRVSKRIVYQWKKHVEEYGSVDPPRRPPGCPRKIPERILVALVRHLEGAPSTSLPDMKLWLQIYANISVDEVTISRNLKAAGVTPLKPTSSLEDNDGTVRQGWLEYVNKRFEPRHIVCTDEGYKEDRPRARDFTWALRGQPPMKKNETDTIYGKRHTILSAVTTEGVLALQVLEGIDSERFLAFIRDDVLPEMQPWPQSRSVLLLDNCPFHDMDALWKLLNAKGCVLLPLPPYSSFYNPIEKVLEKVKMGLKKSLGGTIKGHSETALAIKEEFRKVTPAQIMAYYSSCGLV